MSLFRPLGETEQDLRDWASVDHERIPTGFAFVDRLTQGGIAEGEVALLMAYSGVGKTAIGCNVALHDNRIPTLFFSLEMQARFILKRMAAIYGATPDRKIEEQLRAGQPCSSVDALVRDYPHLAIVDKPGMSLRDMGAAINEATEHWGVRPRRVVVDYLELVGGIASMEAVSAVDKASRKSKDFSREFDVAMFVLHQLNQGGEAHRPVKVKDARYGGNTAADYVIAAYRPCMDPDLSPDMYQALKGDMRIQLLKTRAGPDIHPSGVQHAYDPETMRVTGMQPPLVQGSF